MSGRLFLAATALLCCAGAQRDTEASLHTLVEIRTFVGETVILPCQIKHTADEEVPSVEWSKGGPKPIMAFLYRDGCESFLDKNPVFDYRTSLFMKELIHGNLSLKISNVQLSDAGIYRCRIPRVTRDASTLELFVDAVSEPKLSVVPGPAVTLQCEASCWFPMPEITFLDHQGNDVSAEDPKSFQDSISECFNVTRRATVLTGNRVTCRVHQSKINQTRVTEIYIPEECMTYIPIISVAVVVPFLIQSTIIAFLGWKCCNSEGKHELLSKQSSLQSSTGSNAECQNLTSQADPVQNATAEHRREVDELKSNLHDKDETIRRLNKELNDLRSKQSPVECHHGQPTIYRNPSKSSQGVSKPMNFPPEQLHQDVNPKPAASADSNPKSGNVSPAAYPAFPAEGTHAGRLRSVSDSPPRSNSAKAQRRYSISAPSNNRFSVLANLSEDGSEPLLKRRTE